MDKIYYGVYMLHLDTKSHYSQWESLSGLALRVCTCQGSPALEGTLKMSFKS